MITGETKVTTTIGFLLMMAGTFTGLILNYARIDKSIEESGKNQILLFTQQKQITDMSVNLATTVQKLEDFRSMYEADMRTYIRERKSKYYPSGAVMPFYPKPKVILPRELADQKPK